MSSVDEPQNSPQESITIHASCACGTASYKLEGKPLFSIYCHCTICQRANAGPFTFALHYPLRTLTWTHADPEAIFMRSSVSAAWKEWRCKSCLCLIGYENPKEGKWSIRGALFSRNAQGLIENWDHIKPTDHVFYGTRMLDINDGLPKWEGWQDRSRRMDLDASD